MIKKCKIPILWSLSRLLYIDIIRTTGTQALGGLLQVMLIMYNLFLKEK